MARHAGSAVVSDDMFVSDDTVALPEGYLEAVLNDEGGSRKSRRSSKKGSLRGKHSSLVAHTRSEMRKLARNRRQRVVACVLFAGMVGGLFAVPMGISVANNGVGPKDSGNTGVSRVVGGSMVSRDYERTPLKSVSVVQADGKWELDGIDVDSLVRWKADNHLVAQIMDQDGNLVPAGFNPNHATGDSGLAYDFSQCTWWVYLRRKQLGLPVGSYFGNGCQWADSARRLGYWVDNTPRHEGDIMVFAAGQADSDGYYGHVAVVEKINADGSITTSECGASFNGQPFSRTFGADEVGNFQYIHY